MFIDELCGSWLDHPFWKSAFVLTDPQRLQQITSSPVKEVWIDTSKGLDVEDTPQMVDDIEVPATASAKPHAADPPMPTGPGTVPTATMREEVVRAGRICAQARGAMKAMFLDVRMGKAIDAEHCLPVVDDITQSVQRNPGAIISLARLKTSDDYTYMHSVAVCALMVALAHQLKLSPEDTREAGLAGLVHDLGKCAMPMDVLNKPGKLTDAEFAVIRNHPQEGHRLLMEGQGVGPIALDVCLHHHEKINGTGYPHKLKGDAISLFAKMGAVCDVYDAITSNRPYKAGWDPAESILRMVQWTKEGHFDDTVFQAFVRSIGIYPTGSLVKMRSGRLGVVVEQGSQSLLSPIVKVFFSTKSNQRIVPELLELGPRCSDQIVSRESPTQWKFADLDELWCS